MLLNLKKKKKPGGGLAKRKKAQNQTQVQDKLPSSEAHEQAIEDDDMDEEDRAEEARLKAQQAIRDDLKRAKEVATPAPIKEQDVSEPDNADDPEKTIPLARYNPMLAVLKNTLYMLSLSSLSSYRLSLVNHPDLPTTVI